MSFEYPYFFLIIALYVICRIFCRAKDDSIIFPNAHIVTSKKSSFSLLEFLLIILLATALSSPYTSKIFPSTHKGYNIVIDLDTSGSMAEFHKLDAAKEVTLDFANKRKNDALGLVVFGNIAYIASPLTFDKKTFKNILKRIYVSIAGGKTAIYDALFLSSNLFKNKDKQKIIILITDGVDNASITPLDVTLKKLKNEHIKVFTIGIGQDTDTAVLEKIAKATGGKYYQVYSLKQLKEVYKSINTLTKTDVKSNIKILKHYYFQYPLALALILFIFYIYRFRRNSWSF